eukprot:4458529-Alexandrium_andersonii.AAC.1
MGATTAANARSVCGGCPNFWPCWTAAPGTCPQRTSEPQSARRRRTQSACKPWQTRALVGASD